MLKKNNTTTDIRQSDREHTGKSAIVIIFILSFISLYTLTLYNYLLYHTAAELFSIIISFSIFIVAWNSRHLQNNSYFLVLGIAYFFIGSIDLLHTIGYKGMNIFRGYDTNLPTQLWIAARYMESFTLLATPFFLKRKVRTDVVFFSYSLITVMIVVSVFILKNFPVCFVEGAGLTIFKKVSEYIISLILLFAVIHIYRREKEFDRDVLNLLVLSIILTICSELSFTFYIHAYGISNMVGHFLKIVSFYLIYKAVVEKGIREPYDLLYRELKQSKEETDQIINSLTDTLFVFDPSNGKALRWNKVFSEISGYTDAEIAYKKAPDDWYDKDDLKEADKALQKIRTDRQATVEISLITKSGQTIPTEYSVSLLDKMENDKQYIVAIGRDVTERRRMDEALRESEKKFRAIFDLAPIGIAMIDTNTGRFIKINKKYCQILLYTEEEMLSIDFLKITHPDDLQQDLDNMESLRTGEILFFDMEKRYYRKDGAIVWVSLTVVPLWREGETPVAHIAIVDDITEKKNTADAVAFERDKLLNIMNSIEDGIYIVSRNHDIEYINPVLEREFGPVNNKKCHTYFHDRDAICPWCKNKEVFSGQKVSWQWYSSKTGRTYDLFDMPIKNADGSISKFEIFHDITEHKRMEAQIKSSLKEKEMLLGEIHHRVKNNLAIVSSMLSMQRNYITDKKHLELFKESENRIKSMALIHEKLYKSEDMARIDFREYIESLANNLFKTYKTGGLGKVDLQLDVEEVCLGIDMAVPCGLLLNELLTNALKHAFPDMKPGELYIKMHKEPNNGIEILVRDNGVGLPDDLDIRNTESLGFQLIVGVSESQLRGEIEVKCNGGVEVRVCFIETEK